MATRHESVRLTLDDAGYSTGVAKAAAITALLDKTLDDLDGSQVGAGKSAEAAARKTKAYSLEMAIADEKAARLKKSLREQASAAVDLEQGLARSGNAFRRNGADIDQFSGRLAIAVRAVGAFGPALVPIGALAVPALAGMVSQLGFLAGGAITTAVAFQGVGKALESVNAAALEPTAANLENARAAMDLLAPSAQKFVMQLQSMRPALADVRDAGAAELFPALSASLGELESVLPKAEQLFASFGDAVGHVAQMASGSLAGGDFDEFIDYLSAEAGPTLTAMASTAGSLAQGMAELVMAMDPLSDGFTGWLQDAAQSFEDWATGLSATDGFAEFVDYIQSTGPQVADTMASLADAILQIAKAAAPLGGPVLMAIEGIARALAAVVDSPIGPPLMAAVTALSALRLASQAAKSTMDGLGSSTKALAAGATATTLVLIAAGVRAINAASRDALPGVEGMTKALLELRATKIGNELGEEFADIGESIDRLFNKDPFTDAGDVLYTPFKAILGETNDTQEAIDEIEAIDTALANLANTRGPEVAAQALQSLVDAGYLTAEQLAQMRPELDAYDEALAGIANSADAAGRSGGNLITANAGLAPLFGLTGDAARDAANGLDAGTTAAVKFANAVKDLNALLTNRASLRDYEEGLDALNQSVKDNGNNWDVTGEKGRANLSALDGQVGTVVQRVNNLRDSGHQLAAQKFLTRAIGDLEEFRAANPKAAAAMQPLFAELRRLDQTKTKPVLDAEDGPLKDKARNSQRLLNQMTATKYIAELTGDPSDVAAAVAAAKRYLASIDGDVATTTIVTKLRTEGQGPTLPVPSALGNIFTYASGGMDRRNSHWPEFAGPGPTRMWREPETKGESYIPHANDFRRPRAKSILEQTAGMFGGQVQWFAKGGLAGGGGSNPLQGIGDPASLGINPFAASLHNLTQIGAREYDSRELQLDRTDAQFKRILEKREERAKKEADADKSKLDAMLDVQRAFEEQVAGLFKSDVFAKGDTSAVAVFPDGSMINLGKPIGELTPEDYLDYQSQGAVIQSQSGYGGAVPTLEADNERLRQAIELYKQLQARGFDGPAFQELVGNADVEALQYYANLPRAELAQIERLYEQRDQLAGQAGQVAGNDFDKSIGRLERKYELSLVEARELNRKIDRLNIHANQTNTRLASMEASLPPATGRAVGEVINGAARDGSRGRPSGSGLNSNGTTAGMP